MHSESEITLALKILNELTQGQDRTLSTRCALLDALITILGVSHKMFYCSNCFTWFDYSVLARNQEGQFKNLWCEECNRDKEGDH